MSQFEDGGAELLALAGWREGRRVLVDKDKKPYADAGYGWPDFVHNLLTEFGGLVFGKRFGSYGSILTIDASLASSGITKERVEEYEEFLNLRLFPIGVTASGYLTVMVTPDNEFYGGYDDSLEFLGLGVREMLGRIAAEESVKLR